MVAHAANSVALNGVQSSWVGILLDVIAGVESALWEGCYPALTLAPTCEANRASWQVFINAGAGLLCTPNGICVSMYV